MGLEIHQWLSNFQEKKYREFHLNNYILNATMCWAQSQRPGIEINQGAESAWLLPSDGCRSAGRDSKRGPLPHPYPLGPAFWEPWYPVTRFFQTLNAPEISLENPHVGDFWFSSVNITHTGRSWDCVFPGSVCSVIYYFWHLSQEPL